MYENLLEEIRPTERPRARWETRYKKMCKKMGREEEDARDGGRRRWIVDEAKYQLEYKLMATAVGKQLLQP